MLGDIPSAFRHPLVIRAGDANCHNAPDGRFEDKPGSALRHLVAIGRQQPQSGNVHLSLDLQVLEREPAHAVHDFSGMFLHPRPDMIGRAVGSTPADEPPQRLLSRALVKVLEP